MQRQRTPVDLPLQNLPSKNGNNTIQSYIKHLRGTMAMSSVPEIYRKVQESTLPPSTRHQQQPCFLQIYVHTETYDPICKIRETTALDPAAPWGSPQRWPLRRQEERHHHNHHPFPRTPPLGAAGACTTQPTATAVVAVVVVVGSY